MIIDGHAHVCGNYLDNTQIEKTLEKNNVDYVILTAGELNSSKVYSLADKTERFPQRDLANDNKLVIKLVVSLFGVAKQIPLGHAYVYNENIEELARAHGEFKFDGVKIHQCWVNKKIKSLWFEELLKFNIRNDIPLFIHLSSFEEIDQLVEITKEYKDAIVIVAHCIGLEKFIEKKSKLSRNVYFDISNNYFVSKARILNAIDTFGASRVVLGSDTPYGKDSLRLTINRVSSLEISTSDKEDIFGNNLGRILKIST
jgi:predicted TIM-barrel fold metal-dependent hydrolase